jgi:hypothetical protein
MNPETVCRTKKWVVLRWDTWGFHYVGPFSDGETALAWAIEYEVTDLNWHTQLLDPTASIAVRDPGPMPPLLEPGPYDNPDWLERQGPVGDFYVLMVASEPLHLVGPFPDHQHAYSWGMARPNDEDWQLIWLNDPSALPDLLRPSEAYRQSALVGESLEAQRWIEANSALFGDGAPEDRG